MLENLAWILAGMGAGFGAIAAVEVVRHFGGAR